MQQVIAQIYMSLRNLAPGAPRPRAASHCPALSNGCYSTAQKHRRYFIWSHRSL